MVIRWHDIFNRLAEIKNRGHLDRIDILNLSFSSAAFKDMTVFNFLCKSGTAQWCRDSWGENQVSGKDVLIPVGVRACKIGHWLRILTLNTPSVYPFCRESDVLCGVPIETIDTVSLFFSTKFTIILLMEDQGTICIVKIGASMMRCEMNTLLAVRRNTATRSPVRGQLE